MAKKFALSIDIAAINRTAQGFREVARGGARMARSLRRSFGGVASAGRAMAGGIRAAGLATAVLTAAAGFGVKGIVDTAAAFEKYESILETIQGSSTAAKKSMAWVSDFAAKTPFELNEVVGSFVKLKAFGLEPTGGLLRTLGDTAAGMGKNINQAVEAIADAVTGENERLKEFGIKASTVGKKVMFAFSANGKEMVQAATVGNRKMIQAVLTSIWNQKYAGAMDKLSGTWIGLMSNLGDQWTRFQNTIAAAGPFQFLKTELAGLLETINQMAQSGELQELARVVAQVLLGGFLMLKGAVAGVAAAIKVAMPTILQVVEALGGWETVGQIVVAVFGGIAVAAAGLLIAANALAVGIVAGVAVTVGAIVAFWTEIKDFYTNLLLSIVQVTAKVQATIGAIQGAFGAAGDFLSGLFGGGPARPAAPVATLAERGVAPGGQPRGEMVVRFENAPAGTVVEPAKADNLDISTDVGFSLAGAGA